MLSKQTLKLTIPFILLFTLFILLAWELFYSKPSELPSALIGEEVPAFKLPDLYPSQPPLTQKTLTGQIMLLNVWATWCYACSLEHGMLMKIKNEKQMVAIAHEPLEGWLDDVKSRRGRMEKI